MKRKKTARVKRPAKPIPEPTPLRLNIGAGDTPIEGFTPVDRTLGSEAYPLAYPDNSAETIRASHVLEHFSHRQTLDVLREWVRVLKPGGNIRIAVPNADWIARKVLERNGDYPLQSYLSGGQVDDNDYHKASFNEDGLRLLMHQAGLRRIRRWKSEADDCAALPVSLNLEGTKPAPLSIPPTLGILSLPRTTWTANFSCAVSVLPKLNVDLRPQTGVYWHHKIDRGLCNAIKEGFIYALTLDYDSVFTKEQVTELFRLMDKHPEADAICGMQMRRELDAALLGMRDKDGTYRRYVPADEFDTELTRVNTAHFGLTLFRTEALKTLPAPWFMEKADESGHYGDGRVDADVAFWQNWEKAGKSLYVANFAPVGHLEVDVSWPTPRLVPYRQKLTDWNENGIPMEVRR